MCCVTFLVIDFVEAAFRCAWCQYWVVAVVVSFLASVPVFFGEIELHRDRAIVEPIMFDFVSAQVVHLCTETIFVVL